MGFTTFQVGRSVVPTLEADFFFDTLSGIFPVPLALFVLVRYSLLVFGIFIFLFYPH